MLKIVTTPNNILTQPAKPVLKIDEKIIKLISDMEETLVAQKDPEGVGLAAPQVEVDLSIFIIKPTPDDEVEVFVNPKIIKQETLSSKPKIATKKGKKESKVKLEGCLSIPKIWGPIKRAEKILLEYENIKGEKKSEWFEGFKATIIQHEVDHLQGVLFTQRSVEQNKPIYEEKGEELVKITQF